MLYNTFRFFVLMASFMGLFHMIDKKSYEYIIFPTSIIVGVSFSFFDPLYKEHIQRNGKGNSWSWFQNSEYDYGYPINNNTVNNTPSKNIIYSSSQKNENTTTLTNSFFFNKSKRDLSEKIMKHYPQKKNITII